LSWWKWFNLINKDGERFSNGKRYCANEKILAGRETVVAPFLVLESPRSVVVV